MTTFPVEMPPAEYEDPQRLTTTKELNEILGLTVTHDDLPKTITFLGMLLAQTDQDQYNIAFQAESSTGKTYIPEEVAAYFPTREVRIYAGASPTSFFHQMGEAKLLVELEKEVDLQGIFDEEELEKERELDPEVRRQQQDLGKKPARDPRRRVTYVNLGHKVLVFIDQPHWMLMERLRPLLSHDRKLLRYDITDKTGKGGLRTKTVIIKGFPTVIFATAKSTQEDQERTRMWLLSPEASQEKIKASLRLLGHRISERSAFREWVDQDPGRRWLKSRVHMIRSTGIRDIVIPKWEKLLEDYQQKRPFLSPRAQRDWPRLLYIVKGLALLNCFQRKRTSDTVWADEADKEAALDLYEKVARSNDLGLSPEVFNIFETIIQPLCSRGEGVDRRGIQRKYFEVYHRPLADVRLRREILPTLESAGLVGQEPDPGDRRRMLVWCTVAAPISSAETRGHWGIGPENNRGQNSAPPPSPGGTVLEESWTENPPLLHPEVPRDDPHVAAPISSVKDTAPKTLQAQEPSRLAQNILNLIVETTGSYLTVPQISYSLSVSQDTVKQELAGMSKEGIVEEGPHPDCWRRVGQ